MVIFIQLYQSQLTAFFGAINDISCKHRRTVGTICNVTIGIMLSEHPTIHTVILMAILTPVNCFRILSMAKSTATIFSAFVAIGARNWNYCTMFHPVRGLAYISYPIIRNILVVTRPKPIWRVVSKILLSSLLHISTMVSCT